MITFIRQLLKESKPIQPVNVAAEIRQGLERREPILDQSALPAVFRRRAVEEARLKLRRDLYGIDETMATLENLRGNVEGNADQDGGSRTTS